MKKIYLVAALLLAKGAVAQTTVTFEDLNLPTADTAWIGEDGSGGFTSNGVFFENNYDTDWSYWSFGFIYSNMTDVTTAGYTNDESAYTGIGANNSANYSVNYGGSIDFEETVNVSSIAITNTTYAALSMLNGDSFGKQFGSPNDANGNPDGTNGEDWFRLSIIGLDADTIVTDTVVFYLADYRFADSLQDYIVDTWEDVDLTPLGQVQFLEFLLESSDEGQWGMNTPAYFALDNLTFTSTASAKEIAKNAYSVYPNPATTQVTFKGLVGDLSVYNAVGQVVSTSTLTGFNTVDISDLSNGAYTYKVVTTEGVAAGQIVKK